MHVINGIKMIHELYKHSEHLEKLPFIVATAIPDSVIYIRVGFDQFWRNPNGGWDKTDYHEVLETIEKRERMIH